MDTPTSKRKNCDLLVWTISIVQCPISKSTSGQLHILACGGLSEIIQVFVLVFLIGG